MASLFDIGMEEATGGTHRSAGEPAPADGAGPSFGSDSAWGKLFQNYTSPPTQAQPQTLPGTFAPAQSASGGSPWERLMSARTQAPARRRTPRPASGGKVSEQYVVDGLVERGLPEHVARGFAMNFNDESGFDPGINEITPLVEGSRGGYGLYQLTGPRRRQYEAMADRRGMDYSDPDLQLDFLVQELQTTEKRANSRIMETGSAGEAGAAIVNHFLRPSPEHRQSRTNRYLGHS
jgi:hypothetical protein